MWAIAGGILIAVLVLNILDVLMEIEWGSGATPPSKPPVAPPWPRDRVISRAEVDKIMAEQAQKGIDSVGRNML